MQKKIIYVVYCGTKPFALWEEDEMEELLLDLKLSWKVSSAKVCGGRLLDKCYEEIYKAIFIIIKGNPEGINVSINKSAIAIKERVMNFFIFCKLGSFCMK